MLSLQKLYVARFYNGGKKPFAIEKVVAPSYLEAAEKAADWADFKYADRHVVDIRIEKSKGEVVA